MADVDSFRVTWAVPLDVTDAERLTLLCGWLRAHGIDPKDVALPSSTGAAVVCVAVHPVLGGGDHLLRLPA